MVVDALRAAHPSVKFETVTITTRGDRDRSTPIERLGVGAFVREVEAALARSEIDFAVHSLKDLPSTTPPEFTIAAITKREDPRDVLVNRWGVKYGALPEGARIGTSSPRRRAQLLAVVPHVTVLSLRGNVDTRLHKCLVEPGSGYDGGVLAAAGLARMDRLDAVAEFLDPQIFTPAVGQGMLAVETRAGDDSSGRLVSAAEDPEARAAATAERTFLAAMGGGCAVPVTSHAFMQDQEQNTMHGQEGRQGGSAVLTVYGFASDPDGRDVIRDSVSGPSRDAARLGRLLADILLAAGARRLLEVHADA
jgi:hydroxymethylbilane synthase